MEHRKHKLNIILIFGVLFLVVTILLLLVFFAGKGTCVVTFDLKGGTLVEGSLEQRITPGSAATPPTVYKDGAHLKGWDKKYDRITEDIVISAIWISETTPGIIYSSSSNQNFVEVAGVYEYIRGDVYLGDYHGEKKVLGIKDNAFAGRTAITGIYFLDGIINIGDSAFSGCTGITAIDIPKTVTHIGADAFIGCTSLEKVVLHEGLLEIGEGAFRDCTSLTEIIIPASVVHIANDAFEGCKNLIVKASISKDERPENWENGWLGDAGVIWEGAEDVETETETVRERETIPRYPIRNPVKFPIEDLTDTSIEESIEIEETTIGESFESIDFPTLEESSVEE